MGKIEYTNLKVPYLDNEERRIGIYLPGDYETSDKDYPVLYIHDGQNVFNDSESYSGVSWNVGGTLEDFENRGYEGIIAVAIDNSEHRPLEYSPLGIFNERLGLRASDEEVLGDKYLDFLVNDVKSYVEENYRTKKGRKNAYMIGSSAGANITLYASIVKKLDFSIYGIFSPATYIFEGRFEELWDEYSARNHEFYFYVGTEEGYGLDNYKEVSRKYLDCTLNNLKSVLDNGVRGKDIDIQIGYQSIHTEKAWREAFPAFVEFLYKDR